MSMAADRQIWTWFEGQWYNENHKIMGSADHGTWLGTMVFDGARYFDGMAPDLAGHCERANNSALAMGLRPTLTSDEMVTLAIQGISKFDNGMPLYIRPMYWSKHAGHMTVDADPQSTQFSLCLEEASMPSQDVGLSVTTTQFTRPNLSCAIVNAKAACLYPNNGRMLTEANAKGFNNVIACDSLGNVAETATSNIFMAKDGVVMTPIPNNTFLNGLTRQRIIKLLREDGAEVVEKTLTLDDFRKADEIFSTGNYSKVTHIYRFDDIDYGHGPFAKRARALYWQWAEHDTRI